MTASRKTFAKSSSIWKSKVGSAALKRRTTTVTGRQGSASSSAKSLKRPRTGTVKSSAKAATGRSTSLKRPAVKAAKTERASTPSRKSHVGSGSPLNLPFQARSSLKTGKPKKAAVKPIGGRSSSFAPFSMTSSHFQ